MSIRQPFNQQVSGLECLLHNTLWKSWTHFFRQYIWLFTDEKFKFSVNLNLSSFSQYLKINCFFLTFFAWRRVSLNLTKNNKVIFPFCGRLLSFVNYFWLLKLEVQNVINNRDLKFNAFIWRQLKLKIHFFCEHNIH
jgi:hypothetical protein